MRRALLDEANRLVGADDSETGRGRFGVSGLAKAHRIDVDPGDLPLDGSYRWDERSGAFVPGAVRRPTATSDQVLEALAETVEVLVGRFAKTTRPIELPPVVSDFLAYRRNRRG